MKAWKVVGVLLLTCVGILVLYVFFWVGAGIRSDREVKNMVKTQAQQIRKPEVQKYIEAWVHEYAVSNTTWKLTANVSIEDGLNSEFFRVSVFNWSAIGVDPVLGRILLPGERDNPDGVVFYGAGRDAVIYSLDKHPTEFLYLNMQSNELTKITDRIFLFSPDRD